MTNQLCDKPCAAKARQVGVNRGEWHGILSEILSLLKASVRLHGKSISYQQ